MSLLRQVLLVHYEIRPDIFKKDTVKYTARELEDILCDEFQPVFVYADESGRILGHAFCKFKDYTEGRMKPHKSLYIDDICVDEQCRGQHIATTLFEHVKAYAKSLGCHNITLCVWEGNAPARRFYERMGMGIQSTTMETVLD